MANEKSVGEVFTELRALLVAYAKQEVTDPFRRLGRYLGFGIGGAIALGLGFYFLSMAILRGLQHLSWTSSSYGSLVPYLGMVVFQGIVMFVCYRKIRSSMGGKGVGPSGAAVSTAAEEVTP